MVRAQVAILANTVRVVSSVNVRTLVREFLTAALVVAIFTHALGVEGHGGVRAGSDVFLFVSHFLYLWLIASVSTAFGQFLAERFTHLFIRRQRLRNHQGFLEMRRCLCLLGLASDAILNGWHILQLVVDLFVHLRVAVGLVLLLGRLLVLWALAALHYRGFHSALGARGLHLGEAKGQPIEQIH